VTGVLHQLRQRPQLTALEILAQTDRCTHGEPPLFAIVIQTSAGLGIPKMSQPSRKLVLRLKAEQIFWQPIALLHSIA
jgi:hypothetical protein